MSSARRSHSRPRPASAPCDVDRCDLPHALVRRLAYRPFDGTDADVAEPNKVEIEFQPVGALREGSDRSLVAPATVVEHRVCRALGGGVRGPRVCAAAPVGTLRNRLMPACSSSMCFAKAACRKSPGSASPPSSACCLPGVNADRGVGASLAGDCLAALGLGHRSLQRCRRPDPRPACRRICRRDH